MSYDRHLANAYDRRYGAPAASAETVQCAQCRDEVDIDRTDKLANGDRACGMCCQPCDGCGKMFAHRDLFRGTCAECLEDWCESVYEEFGCDPNSDHHYPFVPQGYEEAREWLRAGKAA